MVRHALVPAVGNAADRTQVRRGRVVQHAIHLAQLAAALIDQRSGSSNGAGLVAETSPIKTITCPFTGETLTAVAAIRPDVAVIHAQRADRSGNVQFWGIAGVQKEAVLASQRSVVTVEEIVDQLDPRPGAVVLPSWTVSYVAHAPGGAQPSYALGYSVRDNDYYVAWDAIGRDRDAFTRWLDERVYAVPAGRS